MEHTKKVTFLPFGAGAFFRTRLIEAVGLALLALGAVLATALIGFHPGDPSLNTAAADPPVNPVGAAGAIAADLVLQTLGLSGALTVLVLFAWGWQLIARKTVPHVWLNLVLLPFTLIFAAIALAPLTPPEAWPLSSGLGGLVGQILLSRLAEWAAAFDLGAGPKAIALVAALLSAAAMGYVLGFSRRAWKALLGHLGVLLRASGHAALRLIPLFWRGFLALAARLAGRRPEAADSAPGAGGRAEPVLSVGAAAGGRDVLETRPDSRLVAARPPAPRQGKRARAARQAQLKLDPGEHYAIPPLDLLDGYDSAAAAAVNAESLSRNARLLESVLDDFGVRGNIIKVRPGPIVTLYELEPAPGTKTSRVIGLADDISRSMSAMSARIAAIPGRNVIGIELPNAHSETVYLRELLSSDSYERTSDQLPLALGKDIGGAPVIVDLARMPHLLVAGTTGSGKSVAINAMILSLLYRLPPEACKFILIDPKMLELSVYDDIPHLLSPVVTDPKKAIVALKWTVHEMENRYRLMSKMGVRNISGYNDRVAKARAKGEVLMRKVQTGFDPETGKPVFEDQPLDLDPLPLIVVVVDEMADLMLAEGKNKEIEAATQRLSQMARAAGIHLIMATQRPSVDVITGTIKANFPTRISFQVTSRIDSRTILGDQGAEQLLGHGDMLYMAAGGRITRVHGPLVRDREVEAVVAYLRSQGEPAYLDAVTEEEEFAFPDGMFGDEAQGDSLYEEAVSLVCRERKASTSFVQRHLQIGYNRAARIIEQMEQDGIIGPANHVGKREVLAPDHEDIAS